MRHGETESLHHEGHEGREGTLLLASRCPAIFLTAGTALAALAIVGACARAEAPAAPRDYAIGEVPLDAVQIDQGFWSKRMDLNRTVTIPHIMEENERTGRIENFARAAHEASGPYEGRRFNDSDVYKTIEAASYALAKRPDPELDAKIGRHHQADRGGAAARRLPVPGAHHRPGPPGGGRRRRALGEPQRQPRALQRRPPVRGGGRLLTRRPASARCSTWRSRTPTSWRPRSGRRAARRCPATRRSRSAW